MVNYFMDPTLTVWLVYPLNALGDRQTKTICNWGLNAIAVNATTNYLGVYKVLKSAYMLAVYPIDP